MGFIVIQEDLQLLCGLVDWRGGHVGNSEVCLYMSFSSMFLKGGRIPGGRLDKYLSSFFV